MNTSRDILDSLGHDEVMRRLGVKRRAVQHAAQHGMPPAWYAVIARMCETAGVECPDGAFNWREPAE